MKKCLLMACLGCLLFTSALSQSSWKFRSAAYYGLLSGEAGHYGQVQTINGLYKRSWFLGIGLGVDYYRYTSLPLFLSVTKDLMPAKNGLFLSLDAGTNFPLEHDHLIGDPDSKFVAGPYWSAGLGYKIKFSAHKAPALSLLAGYSFKRLKENAYDTDNTRYDFSNRRLSLKVGIML